MAACCGFGGWQGHGPVAGKRSAFLAWDVAADARNAAWVDWMLPHLKPTDGLPWCTRRALTPVWMVTSHVVFGPFGWSESRSHRHATSSAGKSQLPPWVRFASYGTFEGFTAAGESTGEFSGGDYIAQYGSSWVIDTLWVIGATGYAGLRNLERVSAGVLGVDLGLIRRSRDGYRALGILVSNLDCKKISQESCRKAACPTTFKLDGVRAFPMPHSPSTSGFSTWKRGIWRQKRTYDDTYDR